MLISKRWLIALSALVLIVMSVWLYSRRYGYPFGSTLIKIENGNGGYYCLMSDKYLLVRRPTDTILVTTSWSGHVVFASNIPGRRIVVDRTLWGLIPVTQQRIDTNTSDGYGRIVPPEKAGNNECRIVSTEFKEDSTPILRVSGWEHGDLNMPDALKTYLDTPAR